jgi:ferredoxin-NADP reductase
VNATLLYAHRPSEAVFGQEIDGLRRRHPRLVVRHVVSPARVTEDVIRSVASDPAHLTFYASGPEPLVKALEDILSRMGVPDAHVKRDYFPGYEWS